MTYAERLEAGLLASGWFKVTTASGKYQAFKRDNDPLLLFVGPAGALRRGACASRSHSIGDPSRQTKFYARMLEKGTPLSAVPDSQALTERLLA